MGKTSPYAVSFLLRFIYGVMQILTKVAFNQGTSTYVLNFYRHEIATMFLLPIAFAIERYAKFWLLSYLVLDVIQEACTEIYFCRKTAPQLSHKVCLKLFVHALYGQVKVQGRCVVVHLIFFLSNATVGLQKLFATMYSFIIFFVFYRDESIM